MGLKSPSINVILCLTMIKSIRNRCAPSALNDHVAIVYESQKIKVDLLAELCRIGLERNERCLIATFEGEDIRSYLRMARIDVDSAVANGTIIFQDFNDIFSEKAFDPERTVAQSKGHR